MRNRRASIPSPARLFDPRAVLGLAVSCVVLGCCSAPTAPHSHPYAGDWPVSTAPDLGIGALGASRPGCAAGPAVTPG